MPSTLIEDYDPTTLYFTSNFEDYEGIRHPEDGEYMIDTVYFVQADAPNGVRWRRHIGVAEWRVGDGEDEDGYMELYVYQSVEPKVLEATADKLAEALTESKTRRLNPLVWDYAGACYGSEAYQQLDMEGHYLNLEREEEFSRF